MRSSTVIPVVLLATGATAAEPRADATRELPGPVIRISVDVIQLDVVVTDKQGRHLTDLGPEDFEIREDGRVQPVSHATYVRAGQPWVDPTAPAAAQAPGDDAAVAPAPPRTLVLVYDDFGMSLESAVRARRAFATIVEGLLPTDRVAVLSTSRWNGALRLSSDPQELLAAVSRLGFHPDSRDRSENSFLSDAGFSRLDGGAYDRNQKLTIDSLGVTMRVVEELQAIEGRKAIILVSEGFPDITALGNHYFGMVNWPIDAALGRGKDVPETLRRVGDFAARASVVVHTIDPRGLMTTGLDTTASTTPPLVDRNQLARNTYLLRASQASLQYLPRETGGLAFLDSSDLAAGAHRILDDLSGYYLIGYQPSQLTFDADGVDFHDIEVRVLRKGVKVRTRRGFFGVADEEL
jgi:VWFA-related protein